MKFELEPYHHGVTDEELIADLKRVSVMPSAPNQITQDFYTEHGNYHACTLVRRFGGWLNTLSKASLQSTRYYKISKTALFENLYDVWIRLGRQPFSTELHKPLSRYTSGPYKRLFGSWRKALGAFVGWANTGKIDNHENGTIRSLNDKTRPAKKMPRNISYKMRASILMRDGATCRLCGATPSGGAKLQVDHVVPWSKGGETTIANLQILCEKCNIGKSDIIPTDLSLL